jgi:hypothetical protein
MFHASFSKTMCVQGQNQSSSKIHRSSSSLMMLEKQISTLWRIIRSALPRLFINEIKTQVTPQIFSLFKPAFKTLQLLFVL